jgi:hypothetical protein
VEWFLEKDYLVCVLQFKLFKMKRTDFTNLGGLKFTQNRLGFVQESFAEPLGAIARLCGDKTILYGVEVAGSNVSDGWIVVDGELIQFIGGSLAAQVVITETIVPLVFGNSATHNVHYTKTATCGVIGAFNFSELRPLPSLKNMWPKDSLRQCIKDAAYEAANFDIDGYGIGDEAGWRILSKVYTDAAGAVLVNKKPADAEFGTVTNHGGEKTHTLTINEMPSHNHDMFNSDNASGAGKPATGSQPQEGGNLVTNYTGGGAAHNNLQPYFVVLTLIKL